MGTPGVGPSGGHRRPLPVAPPPPPPRPAYPPGPLPDQSFVEVGVPSVLPHACAAHARTHAGEGKEGGGGHGVASCKKPTKQPHKHFRRHPSAHPPTHPPGWSTIEAAGRLLRPNAGTLQPCTRVGGWVGGCERACERACVRARGWIVGVREGARRGALPLTRAWLLLVPPSPQERESPPPSPLNAHLYRCSS